MKPGPLLVTTTLLAVLAMPGSAHAQEIAVAGTVTDSTEAMLPGVTVTALHVDSGNTFVGLTDGAGQYRIGALRPGIYKITVELAGFATVTQEKVELLVGQRAVLNYKVTLSSVQESVTVTGDAPLVDVTQSKLGGNIDSRQVEALPVNGRNWMQLTMLAPGSRVNAIDDAPLGNLTGAFQLNLDGQQVTATQTYAAAGGQPRFSRDAIGEFELASSRFDATQGRSMGLQVNAVTKAGANTYAGTVSGYFRDDRFNGEDFMVNRVLPYSNQQGSATFGGPIQQNKAHFFGYYEGEREPQSIAFAGPYPRFNIPDLRTTKTEHLAGARVDMQLNANRRLMVRGNGWTRDEPIQNVRLNSGLNHPSTLNSNHQQSGQLFGSLIQTLGQKTVYELKVGLSFQSFKVDALIPPSPTIQLRGYTIGRQSSNPLEERQTTYSVRNDFTRVSGRHEWKFGGDFLLPSNYVYWANAAYGVIRADLGPPPANLEDLFPVWNDPTTWNLAPLSPITRQYTKSVGTFSVHCASDPESCRRRKPQYGAWVQDNWQATRDLTLNLGVRWDFALDGFANEVNLPPVRTPQPQEWLNFGPRLGFAYALPDTKTVIRGGWGLYFAGVADTNQHFLLNLVAAVPERFNDGRPNFAADPWNILGGGREPTYEEVLRSRREFISQPASPDLRTYYSHQTSMGLQRRLGQTMAVQADYVWVAGRREEINPGNVNLTFNPATGANYPFRNIETRRWPDFGNITSRRSDGRSYYHGLETSFTKRFSDHWQASATYTLSGYWNCDPLPPNVTFNVPADLGGECGLGGSGSFGSADQRHRAVFNGIWELPYDFQLSGLYFYGSGQRYVTTVDGDPRDSGGLSKRLRPDGTIVPRNNFVGKPLHRADLRLQRRFPLFGSAHIDGMVEVFNLFNHENYGSYTTNESSRAYGQPGQILNVAYQPRMMQLGFRFAF